MRPQWCARNLHRVQPHSARRVLERELLRGSDRRGLLATLKPLLDTATLQRLQASVDTVHLADPWLDYLQNLLARSREMPALAHGLSPRAGLALLRAARAWALLNGRGHALPEDLKAVLPAVITHRLSLRGDGQSPTAVVEALLSGVPVP